MSGVLVFGASGRTGRHVVELARAAGLDPLPVVRDRAAAGRPGLDPGFGDRALLADLRDAGAVERALRAGGPSHAVISVAGGRGDTFADGDGSIGLIDACVAAGIERFVLVTSLGCGDSAEHASAALLRAIGPVLREKTRAEAHLAATALAWTIVRPGGLADTPATGGGALFDDPRVHGRIGCRDLAALLVALVREPASFGRTLSAVDLATLSGPADARRFAINSAAAVPAAAPSE
jgi:uncharacterized protein YbjT (DUF2867 family)